MRIINVAVSAIALAAFALPVTSEVVPRDHLIEDVRELARLIEDVHPDPYIKGGGKIAFHLRLWDLLQAIPGNGMTRDAFLRILRPFVAGVGDSHTEIWSTYAVDEFRPGGIPLRFRVVENSLYVSAAARQEDREYVGSTLVSVQGIPLPELVSRQKRLVALENAYHVLEELCSHSLWYASYLKDLVPEWPSTGEITFELRRPSGELVELVRKVPMPIWRTYGPESRIEVPSPGPSGFVYDFLPFPGSAGRPNEEYAYLRVDHMTRYGELAEMAGETPRDPSATETFRDLVVDMAEAECQTLIIDLRYNGGGDSLMGDILIYFLYGKDVLRNVFAHAPLAGGGMIVRLSEYYLNSPYTATLEELNEGRDIPFLVGDYDFAQFIGASRIPFEDLPEEQQQIYTDGQYCQRTATFCAEYASGTYAGHYCPSQVIVLVSPWTFSSGLTMTRYLYLAGATLVGSPSGQASNSFCNADRWVLPHTGIEGQVNRMYYAEFPIDSEFAHTLPVHHLLTYETLAAYDFDPNAELLLALELSEE